MAKQDQIREVGIGVMAYGCWELWKARCSAIFEDRPMDSSKIISLIHDQLPWICAKIKVRYNQSTWSKIILQHLQIKVKNPLIRRGQWIGWNAPSIGKVKLNTDGATRGDSSAGGGLIRDEHGHVLAWFSNRYGNQTSLYAEAHALLNGIRLCRALNLETIIIESDSKQLVDMIITKFATSWEITYLLREIIRSLTSSWVVHHIYREQNKSADYIALLERHLSNIIM